MGQCTGISFDYSTTLKACHIKKVKQNKVFLGIAEKAKVPLVSFVITQGNVDDREPLKSESFINEVFGKQYADRGYIFQTLRYNLFVDGIHLVTKMRNNMKGSEILLQDKIHLRKTAVIESINDELKNICPIEHTSHRSFTNFVINLIAGFLLIAFYRRNHLFMLKELTLYNLLYFNPYLKLTLI